jgi:hypothetical protein
MVDVRDAYLSWAETSIAYRAIMKPDRSVAVVDIILATKTIRAIPVSTSIAILMITYWLRNLQENMLHIDDRHPGIDLVLVVLGWRIQEQVELRRE